MKKIVNKSNIHEVDWNNNILTLYLMDGSVIEYLNVPEGIFEGLCTAKSAGSYIRLFINKVFSYRKIKDSNIESKLKDLEHFRDTTVGLWATDRPDLLTEEEKNKCHLFEIKF